MKTLAFLLLVSVTRSSGFSVQTLSSWRLLPSVNTTAAGADISQPGFDDSTWLPVTVPCTVVGCLYDDAGLFPDLFRNVSAVDTSPYANATWWYRSLLPALPPRAQQGGVSRAILRFKGLNYRADVWVNGVLLANSSSIVGTFRYHEVDVSSVSRWGSPAGSTALAVLVYPQHDRSLPATNHDLDLGITFVDWAPTPPDNNLGLWRHVELQLHGEVGLRDPGVMVMLPAPSQGAVATGSAAGPVSFAYANVSIVVQAHNWNPAAAQSGVVSAVLAPDRKSVV